MQGRIHHAFAALTCALLSTSVLAPSAGAAASGGASVLVSGARVGGAEYGVALRQPTPPQATRFSVTPHTVTAGGRRPAIVLRIDSRDAERLRARVVFWPVKGSAGALMRISLGRVRAGRTIRVRWPRGRQLEAGRYIVRVHATDPDGLALKRRSRTPGRVALTVRPQPPPAATAPPPAPAPPPAAPLGSLPAPSPASGTFPVRGPFTYGDLFGAQRVGYRHQGVDISAAAGTPIVSPTAGTIRFTDYQASGGGEYIVQRLADGRDLFYAHCVRRSTVVSPGQVVARGARLCDVGQTGDANGPHLHLELWPAGWRDVKGTAPVDPLVQLRAWGG